jgi:hypothetical protein
MTVQVGQISQKDLEKKRRILSLLESRKKTYGSVAVKTVLVKDHGEWKNSFTIFEVLHRDDPPIEDKTHIYPNFTISRRSISLDELAEIVEDLVTKGRLKIRDLPELAAEGYFSGLPYYEHVSSNDEVFKLEWPADGFTFEPKPKGGLPVEPFVAIDAPLYPGPWEVVRLWAGVDVSRYNQLVGSVQFLLPNFSAKIQELRLASGILTVKIRSREIESNDIVGKVACESFSGQAVQQDIAFDGDSATISLGFVPDWWHVYILSKNDGAALDFRKLHASWSALPAGVVVELGPADIEEILSRGENEQVEFKQEISKKPDEFLETIVAFANSGGGTVFLGVDDNGKAIGVYEQKLDERIHDMVRTKCDPPPEISVEKKDFQGSTVYLVRVAEGDDKPYNLRDKGFFVRAGSTDRLATRTEMDKFYAERESPDLGRRLR